MTQTQEDKNNSIVQIEIPSQLCGSKISPLLFGHNIEITRKACWQGLAAEMLANRKFAAIGSNGFPLHWKAMTLGREQIKTNLSSAVTLDTTIGYAGKSSVRITLTGNEEECGIVQENDLINNPLILEQDRRYNIHVWIYADAPITAIVRVRAPTNQLTDSIIFESKRRVIPANWQDIEAEFTATRGQTAACFEVVCVGSGTLNIGAASLQPSDAFHGMRRDVIECLKAMHVKLLRYPGGCYSEYYSWQEGLLPVDVRPPIGPVEEDFLLPDSDRFDMHEIGIDEFMALCGELGCEASITVRIGEGSPDEAASWVEYCNGGSDTRWGRLRQLRGHSEPYRVKYWSLGNEISAWGKGESTNVIAYAGLCKKFAHKMKLVDPTIRLIGSGMHGVYYAEKQEALFPWNESWNETILVNAGDIFDAYSYHEYIIPTDQLSRTATGSLTSMLPFLEGLRSTIDDLATATLKTIFLDEWNLWDAWNRISGIQEGLYTAVTLHMLFREANRLGIEGSCFFQPVNEGAIRVLPTKAELTPVGQVFSMFTIHAGRIPVAVSDNTAVDVFATLSCDGRSLVVTVINVEEQDNMMLLCIRSDSNWCIGKAMAFAAKSSMASSDVVASVIDVARSGTVTYSLSLPARSFACIDFHIKE